MEVALFFRNYAAPWGEMQEPSGPILLFRIIPFSVLLIKLSAISKKASRERPAQSIDMRDGTPYALRATTPH